LSHMDFSRVAKEKFVYLTSRGRRTGNPHTVELWFAVAGEKVYLSHEGAYSDWMKNIGVDGRVEFKIGKVRFRGNARIAEGGEAFDVGKRALYVKYYGKADEDTIDDWFSESAVIEISMIGVV